jgi:hypothetical protein
MQTEHFSYSTNIYYMLNKCGQDNVSSLNANSWIVFKF